jgi:hypothetical protein
MAQKSNMLSYLTTPHPSIKQERNLFRRSRGYFFFSPKLLIWQCSPRSVHLCPNKRHLQKTMQKRLQFLDYAASQEDAIVTYRAKDMRLTIHSNASYLPESKACSRAGNHMFMAGTEDIPINNGAVLNISQIIRAVMSSAVEAKLAALFINVKMAVSMQCTLEELGHPQTCTPIQNKI